MQHGKTLVQIIQSQTQLKRQLRRLLQLQHGQRILPEELRGTYFIGGYAGGGKGAAFLLLKNITIDIIIEGKYYSL